MFTMQKLVTVAAVSMLLGGCVYEPAPPPAPGYAPGCCYGGPGAYYYGGPSVSLYYGGHYRGGGGYWRHR